MYELYKEHKDKIIAIGECGLDYDRLNYSSKEDQLNFYLPHFDLAEKTKLPMYLHSRNTDDDFYSKVINYLFLNIKVLILIYFKN
jgi:TatD DNase family protein